MSDIAIKVETSLNNIALVMCHGLVGTRCKPCMAQFTWPRRSRFNNWGKNDRTQKTAVNMYGALKDFNVDVKQGKVVRVNSLIFGLKCYLKKYYQYIYI